ncbi:MAG: hypothetical protein PHI79_03380 [Sulfurovaceae bacterium]|nr:hypothetical protein [Sulfurovaceae bacterium]MDD5548623.1 hypothetical protein [Sulfurovaceae bacterium]
MNNDILSCFKNDLISFSNSRLWDKLTGSYEIINRAGGPTKYILSFNGADDDEYYEIPTEIVRKTFNALESLRDQILAETGKRIWGLTFTLYPDGRHEIEYDYNVPEGFNEQGEYIGEECANEAVSGFFDNIRKIGTDEFELK